MNNIINLGDYPTGETIYIPFHTFSNADPKASMTITGLALGDIKIYKDGGVTQRSSTAGFALLDTDGIDFDAVTGIHGISIDTSDDTDAGFYAAGSDYWVVIDSITLDGATISFVAAIFSIRNRGSALDTPIPGSPTPGSINDVLRNQGLIVETGVAVSGTLSTTQMSTDLPASNNIYNGQIVKFTGDTTTVALRKQAAIVSAYDGATTILTFTALTTAPVADDKFIIM